jgi:hypothetical protein
MRITDSTATSIYYSIILFCVFSIKITIINVGETGIRADDLLIFLAFCFMLYRRDLLKVPVSRPLKFYFAFVLVSLLSTAWNGLNGRVNVLVSLLYVVRLVEYLIFYYLGALVASGGRRLTTELTLYLITLSLAVPLQMMGILPTVGAFNGITSRAVGNTNGPYELAAVAAFLLYFLSRQPRRTLKAVLALTLLILSASRITTVATLLTGAKSFLKRKNTRLKSALLLGGSVVVLGLIGLTYASWSPGPDNKLELLDRFTSAASSKLLGDVVAVYKVAPTYKSAADYSEGAFTDAKSSALATEGDEGEVSGAIRLFRWASLIKSASEHPDSRLLGLGPSFGTAAVDGYFVRLYIETGLIGLASFCLFAISLMRAEGGQTSRNFRDYFLVLLGTCCFIDICVSYKPMLLLWLWHGLNQLPGVHEPEDIASVRSTQYQIRWGSHVIGKLGRRTSRIS